MAKVSQGNSLTSPLLQPGFSIENNGYEVLTCKATYKCDASTAGTAFARGDAFSEDSRLKAHKISVAYGALDVATITVDYIGLEDSGSEYSVPNVSGAATLTSEPIMNHPKFLVAAASNGIAGAAPYAASTTVTALKPYTDRGPVFEGDNGAIFEASNGGKFLGFYGQADALSKKLYQRTAYLAPTSTFSGHLFTSNSTNVQTFLGYVGKTMYKRGPDGFAYLLPSYFGTEFKAADEDDQLLIASVHFEDYGSLYKLSYELRFNAEGYPHNVYSSTNA